MTNSSVQPGQFKLNTITMPGGKLKQRKDGSYGKDESTAIGMLGFVFSLFWAFMGAFVICGIFFFPASPEAGEVSPGLLENLGLTALMLLFMVLPGVAGMRSSWPRIKTDRQVQPYRFTVRQPYLQRGRPQTFEFDRLYTAGQGALQREQTLCAQLVCQEVTVMRVGTDNEYNATILHTVPLSPVLQRIGAPGYSARWDVEIPTHLPVTQIEKDHWIVWQFQAGLLDGSKIANQQNFEVEVR